MLTIDERNACFDGDTSVHAHFQCKVCGTITDVPLSPEEPEDMKYLREKGYQIDEIHRYYKGVCPNCIPLDRN